VKWEAEKIRAILETHKGSLSLARLAEEYLQGDALARLMLHLVPDLGKHLSQAEGFEVRGEIAFLSPGPSEA
jgi:hypothetical protein